MKNYGHQNRIKLIASAGLLKKILKDFPLGRSIFVKFVA